MTRQIDTAAVCRAARKALLITSTSLCLAAGPVLAAPPTYTMTFLGSFGGNIQGYGINNSGSVVGIAKTTGGTPYAFFSDGTTTTRLLGAPGSSASDINNNGLLVGMSPEFSVIYHTVTDAVTHSFGSASDLQPSAINDSGQVSGSMFVGGTNTQHAFFYDGTTVHDLGTLGGTNGYGFAINNNGDVAGSAYTSNGRLHAFRFEGSSMQDLGSLTGLESEARGINDSGTVVGWSRGSDNVSHAVIYDGTGIHDLGTLFAGQATTGHAINNSGYVVGRAVTPNGPSDFSRAVLHDGTAMYDLNGLIDVTDPLYGQFLLKSAEAINDNGEIVTYGCFVSDASLCYAFLLKVVPPAPSILAGAP